MMQISRQNGKFPYIIYVPDHIKKHPALLIQLHGAGERGNGGFWNSKKRSEDSLRYFFHIA